MKKNKPDIIVDTLEDFQYMIDKQDFIIANHIVSSIKKNLKTKKQREIF